MEHEWILHSKRRNYIALRFIILHNTWSQGWGLLSQFPPFRHFPNFSALSKHTLDIKYYVHIWQVSPQLSCGDTFQIWMWFKESNSYFCKTENFAYGEINELSFSNPTPELVAGMFYFLCSYIGTTEVSLMIYVLGFNYGFDGLAQDCSNSLLTRWGYCRLPLSHRLVLSWLNCSFCWIQVNYYLMWFSVDFHSTRAIVRSP